MGICTLVAERSLEHVLVLSLENAGRYSRWRGGFALVAGRTATKARLYRDDACSATSGIRRLRSGPGGLPLPRLLHRVGASTP